MNMVGVHIVIGKQRRRAPLQALDRQAVGGIDTRSTQDGDSNAVAQPPGTQHTLGIDTSPGPRTLRIEAARFVDAGTAAIAVNPRRAYVNQAAW